MNLLPLVVNYPNFFRVFAFVLGATIGSFLNVCIYRIPRDLSVNSPRRSFCPHCKHLIPWWQNIPILGWLALRGHCAFCKESISIRYLFIELLTAGLFLCLWEHTYCLLFIPYAVFASLLIIGTFIDFEFFIIPDSVTIGGAICGVIFSCIFPALMRETRTIYGLAWSVIGAAVGYGLLFIVVELGKLAFGKKRIVLEVPLPFSWKRVAFDDLPKEEQQKFNREGIEKTAFDAELIIDQEKEYWSDFFAREKDKLTLVCNQLNFNGTLYHNVSIDCFYDHIIFENRPYTLENISEFNGQLKEYIFPREAMGFGDVKLLAAIGAFIGWRGVLFTVTSASLFGSIFGILILLLGPKMRSVKIPFGPYLALGALLWIFFGPQLLSDYLRLIVLDELP